MVDTGFGNSVFEIVKPYNDDVEEVIGVLGLVRGRKYVCDT